MGFANIYEMYCIWKFFFLQHLFYSFIAGVWIFTKVFRKSWFPTQHCKTSYWPEICTAGKYSSEIYSFSLDWYFLMWMFLLRMEDSFCFIGIFLDRHIYCINYKKGGNDIFWRYSFWVAKRLCIFLPILLQSTWSHRVGRDLGGLLVQSPAHTSHSHNWRVCTHFPSNYCWRICYKQCSPIWCVSGGAQIKIDSISGFPQIRAQSLSQHSLFC